MRRFLVVSAVALLVPIVGCAGRASYEKRMEATLNLLKYTKRLNANLMPAPSDKKYTDAAIYVRPPKEQVEAKTFLLRAPEGQFDLESSFNDKTESALHLLARIKKPKKPAAKGAPPAAAPAAPRGDFIGDVVAVLAEVFGASDALQPTKFKDETKGSIEGVPKNVFKRLIFTSADGAKEIAVYVYKQDIHEVALVFVYDTKIRQTISSKLELCLGSFSVGQKATNKFNGGSIVETPDEAGTSAAF